MPTPATIAVYAETDRPFTMDLTELVPEGEAIAAAVVTAPAQGLVAGAPALTIGEPAIGGDGMLVQTQISGFTKGEKYAWRVVFTTDDGNVDVGVATIQCL